MRWADVLVQNNLTVDSVCVLLAEGKRGLLQLCVCPAGSRQLLDSQNWSCDITTMLCANFINLYSAICVTFPRQAKGIFLKVLLTSATFDGGLFFYTFVTDRDEVDCSLVFVIFFLIVNHVPSFWSRLYRISWTWLHSINRYECVSYAYSYIEIKF